MLSGIQNRKSGSVVVFALLALIAVMALGVVYISRAGRDQTVTTSSPDAPLSSSSTDDETTATETENADPGATIPVAEQTPVNFPPPPPPPVAATPDPKTLPPEG